MTRRVSNPQKDLLKIHKYKKPNQMVYRIVILVSYPVKKTKLDIEPYVCPKINYTHRETNYRRIPSTVLYYITSINSLHNIKVSACEYIYIAKLQIGASTS